MTPSNTELDPRAFRRGLGNFATGVTVITASGPNGEQVGVTANSFNSVSLDPPLILWSLDKRSSSCAVFQASNYFAVNVLAADQIELSNHFSRPQSAKFASVVCEQGLGGAALLPGCAARFQCQHYQQVDAGDHWILIGKVLAFDDFGRAPLLYHQGAYSMALPHPRAPRRNEQASAATQAMPARLSNHNLYYLMFQAVNAYQASYAPKQLTTGLSTSEARMLMMLEDRPLTDLSALQREADMPTRAIEEVLSHLQQKGLITQTHSGHELTEAGRLQTQTLWEIAQAQQEAVFSEVNANDVEIFKKVLKVAIQAS